MKGTTEKKRRKEKKQKKKKKKMAAGAACGGKKKSAPSEACEIEKKNENSESPKEVWTRFQIFALAFVIHDP